MHTFKARVCRSHTINYNSIKKNVHQTFGGCHINHFTRPEHVKPTHVDKQIKEGERTCDQKQLETTARKQKREGSKRSNEYEVATKKAKCMNARQRATYREKQVCNSENLRTNPI